jgi:cytochrome c oxidase assembly protein subunit 15
VRVLDRALLVVAAVVVTTGTVVTATGPHGGDRKAKRFAFDLPVVARIHGTSVIIFLCLALVTFWALRRTRAPAGVQGRLGVLLAVLVAQAIIGYVQYLNNIPEVLVGFHLAGATAVWAAVVWYSLGLTVRDGPAEAPAPEGREPVLAPA